MFVDNFQVLKMPAKEDEQVLEVLEQFDKGLDKK